MSQHIINVRVRPSRVAVLIGKTASQGELMVALRFLSYLWGGRFCPLLTAEPHADDPLTTFRLAQLRPDYVYGIAVEHASWGPRVHKTCQPRGYAPLEAKFVDNLHDSLVQHLTVAHVLRHPRRDSMRHGLPDRQLRLIGCDPQSPLCPFLAALIGSHYTNLGSGNPVDSSWLPETANVVEYIAAHTDIVSTFARCWLDLASEYLTGRLMAQMEIPPTIVLVDSLVPDLALFWNLRQAADADFPVWAIPIPITSVDGPVVLEQLKTWILSFEKYRGRSNFCQVTSSSVSVATLSGFAARFQQVLEGTYIRHVDVCEPTKRIPVVVSFEAEHQLTVDVTGRKLSFRPPSVQLMENCTRGSWMVEFLDNVRTRRAFKGVCLPPLPSAFAVLNTPGPLSVSLNQVPRLGDGVDGINVRCVGKQDVTSIYLPSGSEILHEVLRDGGMRPMADEKRACYLPVIRMFSGLEKAAQSFSGQRGTVLRTLAGRTLTVGEILGRAKLGKGNLPELAQPQLPAAFRNQLDPVSHRVWQQRSRDSWCRESPSNTAVESLLEHWADRTIAERRWRLGPCTACMRTFWEPQLNIARSIRCPGCGSRLRLPQQAPIGYSLHRLVDHAIEQGIIPVVLTGRFLKHVSQRSFFWLPGVKFKWNGGDGDLDVLACCDRHIVVGECKNMGDTDLDAAGWEKILKQFEQVVGIGKACGASLAVLAVMAHEYPDGFQAKAEKLVPPTMGCLLLKRPDLEAGIPQGTGPDGLELAPVPIADLVPDAMPETPRPRPSEPRKIVTRLFTATY